MSTQRTIPFADGMELGLGLDDLTGQVGSLPAVDFTTANAAAGDEGMEAHYDTSLVNTVERCTTSLMSASALKVVTGCSAVKGSSILRRSQGLAPPRRF